MPAKKRTETPTRSLRSSGVVLFALLLVMVGAYLVGQGRGSRGLSTAFDDFVKKDRLVSNMQRLLHEADEAEKAAVMADTDEASIAFADAARKATAQIEKSRRKLGKMIQSANRSEEVAHFDEFSDSWKKYRELDKEVLGLAVENTNLKAQRLSFAPASEPLDRLEKALDDLVDAGSPVADAKEALIAALKIQLLQSRHIAEARDEEMDRIETEMKTLDDLVRADLNALETDLGEAEKPLLEEARAAYADFQKVHAEIISLSRRNSNIRSFAISLGEKRKATAVCRERLNALKESIQGVEFNATR